MVTDIYSGRKVQEIELLDVFPPSEGEITQYFGRIGQGKTYSATADILDLLRRGNVVYCNWRINWTGFDERLSIPYVILSIIFPWRSRFYTFKKENLRYLPVDEHFHEKFEKLTDCYVFLDEGHVVFDSYEMAKLSLAKRASILHTRHFNRSICIISQRPTAIHVAMRANVNRFYKCEKRWQFGKIIRFRRTEYQDMLNETVDDSEDKELSVKQYWGKAEVFDAYPSKYLRGDTQASQKVEFEAYDFGYLRRFALFFKALFGRKINSAKVDKKSLTEVLPVVKLSDGSVQSGVLPKQNSAVEHKGAKEQSPCIPADASVRGTREENVESVLQKEKDKRISVFPIREKIEWTKIKVKHTKNVQSNRKTMEKNKEVWDGENGALVSGYVASTTNVAAEKISI